MNNDPARRRAPNADDREPRRWAALLARAPLHDDDFRYGVVSTGIYCRCGCPARPPRRENVRFFDNAAAAERAGFRPCQRCTPAAKAGAARHAAAVTRACRRLEHEDPAPGYAALAAEAGLSAGHFQRLFRSLVGITPKQYAQEQRRRRLADTLPGSPSVTDGLLAAGFGSLGRAYETTGEHLGMTPSRYRAGGAGERVHHATAACSLGWVGIGITRRGIAAIELADDAEQATARVRAHFPRADLRPIDAAARALLDDVIRLVDTSRTDAPLPLDIRGTAFQRKVWQALRTLRPGETASYAEIARRIGRPGAARAVGRAIGANPLAVAVPCHRAVRADGSLGGYRWGLERKRTLLERERGTGSAD